MQSRNFFAFGFSFNILTDSVFVNKPSFESEIIPPTGNNFLLLDNSNFLLLDGTDFLLL